MPKIMDSFDYLKAADKEDIYTALIQTAFNESELVKTRFCAFFGTKSDPKAKLLLRNPFNYESTIHSRKVSKDGRIVEEPHRHRRQIPDLTLVTSDKIAIIETKLFAPEGSYQTERYGDLRFLESIKTDKKLSSLDLSQAKLHSHRCKSNEDQCLFYVTINGDHAVNPAFKSVTWSDLVTFIFEDLSEINPVLLPILEQMKTRFSSYPLLKAQLIEAKADQGLDPFLRHSAKHFLLSKDYLLLAYFDDLQPIRTTLEGREELIIESATVLGTRQITITCKDWEEPALEVVLASVEAGTKVGTLLEKLTDDPHPFSKRAIKITDNRKVSVCITYQTHPTLSETKLLKKIGPQLTERFRQGKANFEAALSEKGIPVISTLLQVTKTEFPKNDKDLSAKVIAQVQAYCVLLDTLTLKETPYE